MLEKIEFRFWIAIGRLQYFWRSMSPDDKAFLFEFALISLCLSSLITLILGPMIPAIALVLGVVIIFIFERDTSGEPIRNVVLAGSWLLGVVIIGSLKYWIFR